MQQLGYKTLEAADGQAALEICDANQPNIDLIMTDLVMPGMGGRELARNLEDRFPDIQVLLTSGYSEESVIPRGLQPARDLLFGLFQQPVKPARDDKIERLKGMTEVVP